MLARNCVRCRVDIHSMGYVLEPDAEIDLLARNVIGAALEVHRCLGPGLAESIYEQALCIELDLRRIPYRRQVGVSIEYKGQVVGTGRIDLLVADCLVVELKSTHALAPGHVTQVLTYLRAQGCQLGLLLNFDVPFLRRGIRRVVLTTQPSEQNP